MKMRQAQAAKVAHVRGENRIGRGTVIGIARGAQDESSHSYSCACSGCSITNTSKNTNRKSIETRQRRITVLCKVARSLKNSAWNEVFAIILLGVGTLLFLALISYTPRDVPSWVWFSHVSPANHPAQNFIGPFGAIIAGICYHTIGAAAYLLAAVLLGFGAAKLFHSSL